MPVYLTAYAMGGGYYGAYVEADSLRHAHLLVAQRGLGERVESGPLKRPALPNQLTQHIKAENWLEAAHEAAFLGFIGISSGALTAREVLGDSGLVHELLHLARPYTHHPDEDPKIVASDKAERKVLIKRVKAMAAEFEYRVPGWQPSGGKPGVVTGKL